MEEKNVSKNRIAVMASAAMLGLMLSLACGGAPTPDPAPGPTTAKAATTTPAKTTSKAAKTAKPVSAEQRNAARSAQSYLGSESGFSRKSLIAQLKYEGYGTSAATAAVDSLGVDWNAQAALKARSYVEGQAFSRKGLIGQLRYEGFTTAQALYGVKQAGL